MSAQPGERAPMLVLDAVRGFFEMRAPRKESLHTIAAYRNDLRAMLVILARQLDRPVSALTVEEIAPLRVMRRAFGEWAEPRAKRSIRRGHSTWTVFFDYLVSEELVPGSPMAGVDRPKMPGRQPKPFKREAVERIVRTVRDQGVKRRNPWPELDEAIVLFDLVTGARSDEMMRANIADVTRVPGNESVRLLGKGDVERTTPLQPIALDVLARYLRTRRERFPELARKRLPEDASEWDWWPPDAPLFVTRTGARMTKGTLQYLVLLVYRAAGVDAERAHGALTHAMRHTAATRAVEEGATLAELMELFGWRSAQTGQSYVKANAREVRRAAAANPVYELLAGGSPAGELDPEP